jgi:hypothetical protein
MLLLFFTQPSWFETLLETARTFADEHNHELAVVSAVMAAEIVSTNAMAQLIRARIPEGIQEEVERLLPRGSLMKQKNARQLWDKLTGDQIAKADFWPSYDKVTNLRNSLVHRGQSATAAEAEEAIATATKMMEHVRETVRRVSTGS